MPDGLQTGDVVRTTFSGGIGTLENEIAPLAETGQLQALAGARGPSRAPPDGPTEITHLMSVMALTSMSFPSPLFGQSVDERVRVTLEGDKMIGTIASLNQSGFDLNLSESGSLSVDLV